MERKTIFSTCRRYRYVLWREFGPDLERFVMFVCLNPSIADETENDPTLRRCIDFAKQWEFGALAMTNLFAFVATQPADMKAANDPVGPENDVYLAAVAKEASLIVVAWGERGQFRMERDAAVLKLLNQPHCLGFTKYRRPRHPSRVRKNLSPIPFQP
jgi:hypothetical protein